MMLSRVPPHPVLGFDVGTTQCRVCLLTPTQAPTPILVGTQPSIPTAIYFPDTPASSPELIWHSDDLIPPILIGEEALAALLHNPSRGAILFKRRMDDPLWHLWIDNHSYSTEDLLTFLLARMRQHLERILAPILSVRCPELPAESPSVDRLTASSIFPLAGRNAPSLSAVFTVPAYFPNVARKATQKAAQRAGFQVLGLLNEPTAAALAYGFSYSLPPHLPGVAETEWVRPAVSHGDESRNTGWTQHGEPLQGHDASGLVRGSAEFLLVFDMGGGTTDVSLLQIEAQAMRVIASLGNYHLGCQDFDDLLAHAVADAFVLQFRWNPLDTPETFESLRRVCRNTRETLSFQEQVPLHYTALSHTLTQTWTRSQLQDLCQPLLRSCEDLLHQLFQSQVVRSLPAMVCGESPYPERLRVLLAGGGSRMPMIRDRLQHVLGIVPDMSLDPVQATATGAALFAAQLAQQTTALPLSDVSLFLGGQRLLESSAYPLGLFLQSAGCEDSWEHISYHPVFPKHTPLPATAEIRGLTTTQDEQTILDLVLTQAEPDHPLLPDFPSETLIAAYRILSIPKMPAQTPQIAIRVVCSNDGMVDVSAEEEITKQSLPTVHFSPEMYAEQLQTENVQDIVMLVDTSASMEGRPLLEAKYHLLQLLAWLEEQPFSRHRVGLISFGHQGVQVLSPLQPDLVWIRGLVSQLSCGGNTPMDTALYQATAILRTASPVANLPPVVIVLTDGKPNHPQQTAQAAADLRAWGAQIFAIDLSKTNDTEYLRQQICSSPSLYHHRNHDLSWTHTPVVFLPTRHPAADEMEQKSR